MLIPNNHSRHESNNNIGATIGSDPYAFTVFPIVLNRTFTLPWADKANTQSA